MLFAPNSDLLPSYRRSRNRDSSEPGNVFPIFSDVISDCNLLKPMPNSGPSSRIATTSFALASSCTPNSAVSINSALSKRQPENIGPGDRTPITAGSAAPSVPDGTSTTGNSSILESRNQSFADISFQATETVRCDEHSEVMRAKIGEQGHRTTRQEKKIKIIKVRMLFFSSTGV